MVSCARCGRDVEELQTVSPDVMTKELIESIDHGEAELIEEDGLKLCAECIDELSSD